MKLRYYLRGLGLGILVTAFLMGAALGGEKESLSDEEIKARAARLGMVESLVLAEIGNTQEASAPGAGSSAGTLEPSGSKTLSDSTKQSENVPGPEDSSAEVSKPESEEPSEGRTTTENTEPSKDQISPESTEPAKGQTPSGSTEPSKGQTPPESTEPAKGQTPSGSAQPSKGQTPPESTEPSKGQAPTKSDEPAKNQTSPENAEPSKGQPSPENTQPSSGGADPMEDKHTAESGAAEGSVITITIKRGDSSVSVSKALAAAGLVADAGEYDRYLCAGGYDKKICVGVYEIPAGATGEDIAGIITKKSR